MHLTEKFTDKIIKEFKKLPQKKQDKLKEEECMDLDIDDFVYEDYASVLWLAHNKLNIKKATAVIWCDCCDEEFETKVKTGSFKWKCPKCGVKDNQ